MREGAAGGRNGSPLLGSTQSTCDTGQCKPPSRTIVIERPERVEPDEVAGTLRRCSKPNERESGPAIRVHKPPDSVPPKELRRPGVLSTGEYGRQEVGEKAQNPRH